MSKDYFKAIKEINPNAQFTIFGDTLDGITWYNNTTPISNEDIEAKATEIEARDAHIIPRQKAYPSIQEQLDMQYKDKINGTDTWEQAINAVKVQYPKA
jgi:hypothetical protein